MAKPEKDTDTIYLLKPHRHAGRDFPIGAELELPKQKAAWLIGLKVGSRTPVTATPETPKEA